MIFNTLNVPPGVRKQSIKFAEEVFETLSHPDQMQATQDNFNRLKSLSPDSILYEVSSDGDLMGWVVVMPTNKGLAQEFVDKEIGEQKFLEMTSPQEDYDAIYLCAAATLPKYRRLGVATRLTKEALSRISLAPGYELFSWPTSEEGKLTIKKLESETGKVIRLRE